MRRLIRLLLSVVLLLAVLIIVARLVFALPDLSGRERVEAIPASNDTALGGLMAGAVLANPGHSGVMALSDGNDALDSRLELILAAEQSIDAQYYIWHDDTSGLLLLDSLKQAAQRGVRVRLLLDDNGIPAMDSLLAALNAQDNLEIRLFNPSVVREPKGLSFLFDFFRMNRRMHNKSLIVDGAATVIGGRNVGDEYFGEHDAFFVDLDTLATGPVVADASRVFDEYWNSLSVYELASIIEGSGDLQRFEQRVAQVLATDKGRLIAEGRDNSAKRYLQHTGSMEWTTVQLVADDPVKAQGKATKDQLMITRLGSILGTIEERLDLVSAYFIPGRKGNEIFTGLAEEGKQVRILTNAMNTTDVIMVHSGYSKYRRQLLEAGAQLYELKLRGNAQSATGYQVNPLGWSGASLHAKTFAVDGSKIFIGSFNFDPRSAMLNCEMGLLIDSETLAKKIGDAFDGPLDQVSYRPQLTPENKMIWKESLADGDMNIYQEEPGATWLQQIALTVIGTLPVEWML